MKKVGPRVALYLHNWIRSGWTVENTASQALWYHIEAWLQNCRVTLGRTAELSIHLLCKFEVVRNSLQDIYIFAQLISFIVACCTPLAFIPGPLHAACFVGSAGFHPAYSPQESTRSLNMVLIGGCFLKIINSIIKNICLKGNSLLFVGVSNLVTYLNKTDPNLGL